jgi:hypothetical protein
MWFGISPEKIVKVYISDYARRTITDDPYEKLIWKDIVAGFAVGVAQVRRNIFSFIFFLFFLFFFFL